MHNRVGSAVITDWPLNEYACFIVARLRRSWGVTGIISSEYAWWIANEDGKKGAQIDLLIDRNDGVINLCEMKYTKTPYKIDDADDAAMRNKLIRFIEESHTGKAIHLTLVSAQGLDRNAFSDEIQAQIVGDDLFVE